MTSERMARIFLGLLLGAVLLFGLIFLPQTELSLHARTPENGGWSAETLYAQAGKPLRVRMTSDDVLHSFTIGQSGQPPVDLKPGEWTTVSLTFDRPGRYTFYCTRWCGPEHWRMRGAIIVSAGQHEGHSSAP